MIGGKVVDPSALAAHVGGSFAMATWLAVANELSIVLYVPALAMVEVRAVYPDAQAVLSRLLAHPSVIHADLTRAQAREVARLLAESQAWDGTAGRVVLVARERGWPVLTADPGRLRRIAPDLDLDLL
ncbi:MAG: hypothetical protein JO115_20095 [Pseudonocardiales bacterium]|nr:hypothetical protein [Pseudonocardiales bacterium]